MSKHSTLAVCFKDSRNGLYDTEVLLVCEGNKDKSDRKDEWRWSLPGGKCCDKKYATVDCCTELPALTMLREMKEETGFESQISSLLASVERHNEETLAQYMQYVYLVELTGGAPLQNKTPSGADSPKWFKLSAIPRNMPKRHIDILRNAALKYFRKKPLR